MWAVIIPTIIALITLVVTVKLMNKSSDFRWYRLKEGRRYYVASDSVKDSKIGKTVTVYNKDGGKRRIILGSRCSFTGNKDEVLYYFHPV